MKTKLIIALLCACALLGAGYGVASRPRHITPITLRGKVTEYDQTGNVIVAGEYTRYQSANGDWRNVTVKNGRTYESFFAQGRGYFNVDRAHGRLIRDGPVGSQRSTAVREDMSSLPQFHHTEQILGHTAYVLREYDQETGILIGDSYIVPEWGMLSVKEVAYAAEGFVQYVSEPVSVTEGEPAPEAVRGPADLPEVTYDRRR